MKVRGLVMTAALGLGAAGFGGGCAAGEKTAEYGFWATCPEGADGPQQPVIEDDRLMTPVREVIGRFAAIACLRDGNLVAPEFTEFAYGPEGTEMPNNPNDIARLVIVTATGDSTPELGDASLLGNPHAPEATAIPVTNAQELEVAIRDATSAQ